MNHGPRAIDYWYALITGAITRSEHHVAYRKMLAALREEVPVMLSATLERACDLECGHCIYQREKAAAASHDVYGLLPIVLNLARQMPNKKSGPHFVRPRFLHDGRILRAWHLDLFRQLRVVRPDMRLGLIDNGSYTKHIGKLGKLKLDWLDISVDGTEVTHNAQRQSSRAFGQAMRGLARSREVVLPKSKGGRVSTLYTLTNLNFHDILETATLLFEGGLIDQFHVTPVSPFPRMCSVRETTQREFDQALRSVREAVHVFGSEKVFFRIYRVGDLEKLARNLGPVAFRGCVRDASVNAVTGELLLDIGEMSVSFLPASIWPQETFLVDADGFYRTAYSAQYTLSEYANGIAVDGSDTTPYAIAKLDNQSSLHDLYHKCVDRWWSFLGQQLMQEELDLFQRMCA